MRSPQHVHDAATLILSALRNRNGGTGMTQNEIRSWWRDELGREDTTVMQDAARLLLEQDRATVKSIGGVKFLKPAAGTALVDHYREREGASAQPRREERAAESRPQIAEPARGRTGMAAGPGPERPSTATPETLDARGLPSETPRPPAATPPGESSPSPTPLITAKTGAASTKIAPTGATPTEAAPKETDGGEWLTGAEAARLGGVTTNAIYIAKSNGRLKTKTVPRVGPEAIRHPTVVLYERRALEAYFAMAAKRRPDLRRPDLRGGTAPMAIEASPTAETPSQPTPPPAETPAPPPPAPQVPERGRLALAAVERALETSRAIAEQAGVGEAAVIPTGATTGVLAPASTAPAIAIAPRRAPEPLDAPISLKLILPQQVYAALGSLASSGMYGVGGEEIVAETLLLRALREEIAARAEHQARVRRQG